MLQYLTHHIGELVWAQAVLHGLDKLGHRMERLERSDAERAAAQSGPDASVRCSASCGATLASVREVLSPTPAACDTTRTAYQRSLT